MIKGSAVLLYIFLLFSCSMLTELRDDGVTPPSVPGYAVNHYDVTDKSYEFIMEDAGVFYIYDERNDVIEIVTETADEITEIGNVDIDEYGYALASMSIKDSTLFVSQHTNSFTAFDVSNKSAPIVLSEYPDFISPNDSKNIGITQDYAYIVDDYDQIRVINISDPAEMAYVDSVDIDIAKDVIVNGNTLFALGYSMLKICDISNPQSINTLSSLSLGTSAHGNYFILEGSVLYILGLWQLELTIVDISDLENPEIISTVFWESELNLDSAYATGIVYHDGNVFILDYNEGILSIDVSDTANQQLNGLYPVAIIHDQFAQVYCSDFVLYNNYLYVVSDSWGITVIDPSLF